MAEEGSSSHSGSCRMDGIIDVGHMLCESSAADEVEEGETPWLVYVKGELMRSYLREHEALLGAAQERGPLTSCSYVAPIFRVPAAMRRANAEAFEPLMFRFGAYTNAPLLQETLPALMRSDDLHLKLQTAAAAAAAVGHTVASFQALVARIQARDSETRTFYAEQRWRIPHSPNLFVKPEALAYLLALDAVTIVAAAADAAVAAAAFRSLHVRAAIRRDALLLENQIPSFALLYACESYSPSGDLLGVNPAFLDRVVRFYGLLDCPFGPREVRFASPFSPSDLPATACDHLERYCHSLLGLVYDGWVPAVHEGEVSRCTTESLDANLLLNRTEGSNDDSSQSSITTLSNPHDFGQGHNDMRILHNECGLYLANVHSCHIPSATHLHGCGIKFLPNPINHGFTSIRFDAQNRTLYLPHIIASNCTQPYLLNLLAYELTSRYIGLCIIASYTFFMNFLIEGEEDVRLLVESGIIDNRLGSNTHLASMWNTLCTSLPFHLTAHDELAMVAINKAIEGRWHKWVFSLKDAYLHKRPWLFGSIMLTLVLLILTFLQTFYTMR